MVFETLAGSLVGDFRLFDDSRMGWVGLHWVDGLVLNELVPGDSWCGMSMLDALDMVELVL